jgi:electron transfer flavoprotein beta subunit
LLNIPFISLATKLDFNGSVATIMKEMVGGDEVIELSTPFVISAAKGMAEQRIPNMRGIMAARTKPLQVIAPAPCDHLVSYESYELPSAKKECKYVDANNMGELVSLLHNEAKVI